MQYPRNNSHFLVSRVFLVLTCALLVSGPLALHAQETSPTGPDSADRMVPVHLWVAGRTLQLRVSPLNNSRETYVPLTALAAAGAEFRLISNGNAVHVSSRCSREQDIPLVRLNGVGMVALSALAKVLDASIETSAPEPNDKPTFRSPDTVYLLAHVTEARFENGALHVRTSFPVPFQTRMLAETKPARGYVDCVGADLPDTFRPAPLQRGEKQALRLRMGQNSPTVARIVVDLADGVAFRTGDTRLGPLELTVSTYSAPGAKSGEIAPATPQPGRSASAVASGGGAASPGQAVSPGDQGDRNSEPDAKVQNGQQDGVGAQGSPSPTPGTTAAAKTTKLPAPAAPRPVEVRGLDIVTDNPNVLRFDVTTGSKVKPVVRYTPGTTQMLIDIPNALLALPDGEDQDRKLTHPLISGVRMETIQGSGAPTTRLTLDTARILGYSLNMQQGSFSLELRVPRNATGVLSDKLIVVDAGHGGSATGATGAGICEKDCTLAIALQLRAELEACGARVVMTRTRDTDVSLTDRSRMGNEIGADLFVSIHNDSNERSNSASGTSTYYHASDPSSRALATCVQQSVMAITGLPSRGVLSDNVMYASGFAVLRGSSMPAVLCEVAYINNVNDRRKLIDPQFQQRVARAICDGLRGYVEGTPRRTSPAFRRGAPGQPGSTDSDVTASGSAGS